MWDEDSNSSLGLSWTSGMDDVPASLMSENLMEKVSQLGEIVSKRALVMSESESYYVYPGTIFLGMIWLYAGS